MRRSSKPLPIFAPVFVVVTAIMTALALLVLSPEPGERAFSDGSRTARIEMKGTEVALQQFRFDTGRYPMSDEGLKALIRDPGNLKSWRGPYLEAEGALNDPWERPFIYRSNPKNDTNDLICYGRDGIPGGQEEDRDILQMNREFP